MSERNIDVKSQMNLLQQLYDEELQKTEDTEKRWTKLKEDYECLEHQLSDLPKELTKDVMVPVGPRALMMGKIVHTNEILVRLGEDWFAKRSASQASEICQRRLTLCKEKLDAIRKAKQLLSSRKELPLEQEAYGEKEIVEHCTEQELEQWRIEHHKKEKEYRKKLAELHNRDKTTIDSEEALWKRLDELELQEELEDELHRLDDDGDDDDDDYDDEEDDEYDSDGLVVNFSENNIQGGNGLIRKRIVVQDSETATKKLTTATRRVSFPNHNPEENEETSSEMPASSSGRRVSFSDLPPEDISSLVNDAGKPDSHIQHIDSQSAPSIPSINLEVKNSQNSLKSPKSILKIKNSDPSTIYTQEPDSSLMANEESDPDLDSVLIPPVSAAVVEHNPENIESSDSTTNRPLSRFRATRNKR